MGIIPASLYFTIYIVVMAILVIAQVPQLNGMTTDRLLQKRRSPNDLYAGIFLSLFFVIYFGFRDPNSILFADTVGYSGIYFSIANGETSSIWYHIMEKSDETIWSNILIFFAINKIGVSLWYTLVAAIYIFGTLYAVKRIFPNYVLLGCTFAFLNFGFYGGAVNGIRNAEALAVVLIAISFIMADKHRVRNLIIVCVLFIIAYLIHHSIILPAVCLIVARFIIKKPMPAIIIWLLSIGISLAVGNGLTPIFQGLGFDDRLDIYLTSGTNLNRMSQIFSHTGFRWDFVLFSALPICWGWYVIKILKKTDRTYNLIYITYVLANSFWVLIIRVAFSNRFAMLSWSLYFLVILYPLLKFKLYSNQGRKISIALVLMLLIAIII